MCDHDHNHDHNHEHSHVDVADHHHDHSRNELIARQFLASPGPGSTLKEFFKIIHDLDSPVDFYEHNQEFRKKCDFITIKLRWGIKANVKYKFAYVMLGEGYTILSNYDLACYDHSAFPWEGYNILERDD